jgi:hypothetical protein
MQTLHPRWARRVHYRPAAGLPGVPPKSQKARGLLTEKIVVATSAPLTYRARAGLTAIPRFLPILRGSAVPP